MKSLAELQAIRDKARASVTLRESAEAGTRVLVGMATCGIAAGARPVLNAFVEEVAKRGLQDIMVTQTGCIGICQYEPVVEVVIPGQEKVTYVKMTPEKAVRVVNDLPIIWLRWHWLQWCTPIPHCRSQGGRSQL